MFSPKDYRKYSTHIVFHVIKIPTHKNTLDYEIDQIRNTRFRHRNDIKKKKEAPTLYSY